MNKAVIMFIVWAGSILIIEPIEKHFFRLEGKSFPDWVSLLIGLWFVIGFAVCIATLIASMDDDEVVNSEKKKNKNIF